jgi:hypothetical protein
MAGDCGRVFSRCDARKDKGTLHAADSFGKFLAVYDALNRHRKYDPPKSSLKNNVLALGKTSGLHRAERKTFCHDQFVGLFCETEKRCAEEKGSSKTKRRFGQG